MKPWYTKGFQSTHFSNNPSSTSTFIEVIHFFHVHTLQILKCSNKESKPISLRLEIPLSKVNMPFPDSSVISSLKTLETALPHSRRLTSSWNKQGTLFTVHSQIISPSAKGSDVWQCWLLLTFLCSSEISANLGTVSMGPNECGCGHIHITAKSGSNAVKENK